MNSDDKTPTVREFTAADIIKALGLPEGTRLEFSGVEWAQEFAQEFDKHARIVAKVAK